MKRDISQLLSLNGQQVLSIGKHGVRKERKVQALLKFPSTSLITTATTCKTCGMTYVHSIHKEKQLHEKYHVNFMNGVPWTTLETEKVIQIVTIMKETVKHTHVFDKDTVGVTTMQAKILIIDKKNKKQVKKTEELIDMVNRELNASDDSKAWRKENLELGKAFVIIIDERAIGICTTDPIKDVERQSRWLVHRTQTIVPNQINKLIQVGVSRIWIAPRWRRCGLAIKLLDVVLKNLVYGIALSRRNIGFSQPSHFGGLLAKTFCGVEHKSGETLIPIYLEE
ncbi:uncharacterized protein PRCAT00001515001 [Priceomyces carsonii]|uniref:uncharacterized protein n=1 Tax=Priceomyces carsonii TaxID=28549 RepID=UPI002ED8F0EF|nr:unnamed protein product [Priceomyces carsonii]